jgi:hypothetical protein
LRTSKRLIYNNTSHTGKSKIFRRFHNTISRLVAVAVYNLTAPGDQGPAAAALIRLPSPFSTHPLAFGPVAVAVEGGGSSSTRIRCTLMLDYGWPLAVTRHDEPLVIPASTPIDTSMLLLARTPFRRPGVPPRRWWRSSQASGYSSGRCEFAGTTSGPRPVVVRRALSTTASMGTTRSSYVLVRQRRSILGRTSFRARITMIWVMNVASFQAAWMRYMIWLFEDESCGYNYNTNTSSICPPTLHENGTFHFQRNVKRNR